MAKEAKAPRSGAAQTASRAKSSPAKRRDDELSTKEMRRSLRARRPFSVSYANLTHSATAGYHYYRSAIVDLSDTGLGLIVEDKIEKGDLLQVVVSLPVRPYVATGLAVTMWVRTIAAGARFRAGLRFVQMPTELSERIIEQLV